MSNDQNTIAGTANGSTVNPSYGNKFFDSLSNLARVGSEYVGLYSSFREAGETERLEEAQQVAQPQETTPSFQVTNAPEFLSDPARVKKVGAYALIASGLVLGMILIAKKL